MGWSGMRIARVLPDAVTSDGTVGFLGRTMVSGPGRKLWATFFCNGVIVAMVEMSLMLATATGSARVGGRFLMLNKCFMVCGCVRMHPSAYCVSVG